MMRTLFVLVVSIALVGCIGGIDSTQTGDDDGSGSGSGSGSGDGVAKALFDTNVYPVISVKCGGGGCHTETGQVASPIRFVAMSAASGHQVATSFQALVGNFAPSTAGILTKIEGGAHYNVMYAADEITKITDWLNKEVEERNGGTGSGSGSGSGGETADQATQRVLAQYRGCMTIDDFQAAGMANAWGNLAANNGQQCEGCHSSGAEGFVASQNNDQFYALFSTYQSLFIQYLTVDLSMGPTAAAVIINEQSFKGVSAGVVPHATHPRFDPLNNNGMIALKSFHDLVKAKVAGGQCPPPAPFPMN